MFKSSERTAPTWTLLVIAGLAGCSPADDPGPAGSAGDAPAAGGLQAAEVSEAGQGLATGHFGENLEAVEISLAFRPDPAPDRAGHYGYGQAPTPEEIAGWDIDIRPDGQGLPPGSGSVADGEMLYEQKCAECHGSFGEGQGRWPVLAGGFDSLTHDRPEKTVGSYWPYASTLWDYIHRAMPFYAPQSLSDDEVYAIAAYVLYLNDIVDDEFVLTQDNLADIEMPNADGFFAPDPRPDVRNEPCMSDCKDPASIRITWDSTELGVTPTEHLQDDDAAAAPAVATTTAPAAVPAAASLDAAVGERVYQQACQVCHAAGLAGAPKTGDADDWSRRAGQGWATLVGHAVNGYQGEAGYMPAKGGQAQLGDDEVAAAVAHMLSAAGVAAE